MNLTGKIRPPLSPPGRGPRAALTAALAIGLVASGTGVALAARAAGPARGVVLGAGQVASRFAVPWRRVGAGWLLAEV